MNLHRSSVNTASRVDRLQAIDGLRAAACLMVVSHHCFVHGGRYPWPLIRYRSAEFNLSHLLSLGYIGVEFFFVLSGFCLTFPILKSNSRTNWASYAKKRILRICPPYLVVFFFLAAITGAPTRLRYWFYGIFFVGTMYNASFWTLCVEARWYILLPFLVGFYRRCGFAALLGIATVVSVIYGGLCLISIPSWPRISFLLSPLPFFLPTFVLGIGAACLIVKPSATAKLSLRQIRLFAVSSLLLVLALTPKVPGKDFLSFQRIIPASLLALAAIWLALYDPLAIRILTNRVLVKLGIASYSIYLVHEPIIHSVYDRTRGMLNAPAYQFVFFQCLVFPFVVTIGYLFHLAVESPMQKYLRKPREK